jgi:hypothetical protein
MAFPDESLCAVVRVHILLVRALNESLIGERLIHQVAAVDYGIGTTGPTVSIICHTNSSFWQFLWWYC